MKTPDATRRYELRLPIEWADRLDRLKRITSAVSTAEVVRNAIKAYEDTLNIKGKT